MTALLARAGAELAASSPEELVSVLLNLAYSVLAIRRSRACWLAGGLGSAILIHLALLNPDAKLAPQPGTTRHASFLQWMCYLSANIYEAALRIYYSARYSPRGEADATLIREQGIADFISHISLPARSLNPFLLGAEYSIADTYLYMLASWFPDRAELNLRLPALAAHSAKVAARPAVAKVEADHAAHSTN